MSLSIRTFHQTIPLAQVFRISRGAKTTAEVIVVVVGGEGQYGWAEAVPYAHYGESVESVTQQLDDVAKSVSTVNSYSQLTELLPAGSARNALDCALWDLKAKIHQTSVNQLLELPAPQPCVTAQTLSIGSVESMRKEAEKLKGAPLIKVKLDTENVLERMEAIHQASPDSHFIIDANESWDIALLNAVAEPLSHQNVVLIEQPLPADKDDELLDFDSPITLCADESCHSTEGLNELVGKYQAINIKLDKTGGLTEAVALLRQAKALDLKIMLGCMVGSSLAMAPSFALTGLADFVDLDGPLLVAHDRENKFEFNNGVMSSPLAGLWGTGDSSSQDSELVHLSQK